MKFDGYDLLAPIAGAAAREPLGQFRQAKKAKAPKAGSLAPSGSAKALASSVHELARLKQERAARARMLRRP